MSVIDAALARTRTVLSVLALILIAGTAAYVDIPKEADPDINIPTIYVSMTHEGISPEDAERLLVRPMEQELRTIEGVKEMRSTAYQGGAFVILEFDAGFDADTALDDVREGVDVAKTDLPDATDDPTVHEINFSLFPVVLVTLSGEVPERTLRRLADRLQDEIEGIPAVLEAKIAQEREQQVEVVIDPAKVESYGLDARQVIDLVDRSNLLVAAGALDTGRGRFAVKVPGLFESVRDIMAMPLKASGDAVVTFADIAEIRRTYKDPEGYTRLDGEPAVTLEVSKRTGENIIDTISAVRAAVDGTTADWPDAVKVTFSQDKSTVIETMLTDLQNNVISAVLLVMVVVVAALGLHSAGFVGVAVPGSFLTAILVLYAAGLTINIVVLFALILAVGMLVDGAIVVTEYADRKMNEGMHRRGAYSLAAKRMAWPIIASTATTLAAFLPLLFWPGVVGEFMKFLPITLIATLSASLMMALVFVPTLGALVGRPSVANAKAMKAIAAGESGDLTALGGFTGAYIRTLKRALRHPGLIILTAVAMLIGVQVAYSVFGKGVEFFPEVEPERAAVQVHARGNLSVDEKDALVREVEAAVLAIGDRYGEFKSVYTRTGNAERVNDEAEDIVGTVQIEFEEWDERRPAAVILDQIMAETAHLAGIQVEPREEEQGPPIGKPIQIQLSAVEAGILDGAVQPIVDRLESMDGVVNIEDSRPLPGIDWEIRVDRAQAAKFGADVTTIGNAIKLVTNGIKLSEYRPDDADDEVDIVARYPVDDRTIAQLDMVRVQTDAGLVPISNFVEREPIPKSGTLRRVDGHRVLTVKADVEEGVLADDKVRELKAWLPTAGLNPRIEVEFKGEDEEQKEAQGFLMSAFGVALFIMAIVLVTQFNSFYSALLILSAVIMSTIGVMIGLLIVGEPFGIVMTGVGVIALAGIVVNNNIVLIDTYDRLKTEYADPMEAILRTGAQRLRPVLLTTVTTVLGLMPMVLSTNIDFITREISIGAPSTQWWVSLATAIVFGLSFATVLTLVVTPSALMLRCNVQAWRERRRAARGGGYGDPVLAE